MSNFEKLVDAAVKNELELKRLSTQNAELSPKGYLAAALAVPGASAAEADAIESALAANPNSPIEAAIRRMQKTIIDFKKTGPITRYGGYIGDDVASALMGLGVTPASLFLVAARRVTASRPELFGKLDSLTVLQGSLGQCQSERQRLYAEIEKSFDASDLEWDNAGRVWFKGTSVALHTNFAESLVNWHVSQRMAKAA